ncbi:hypothetical protein FHS29_003786 [Saccharothrix tamanrassetensis]|uniref:YtkA-like domain-containing protein n=1 Tax=Saccharothrix tamanrassetensis TaxID=1051531 RepID=A0A841CJP5_9PSEU|nr:FixH family protein [Saccharothrix tamanrassetensis]MBB5957193.1 hypothetical protein [Saccharothrix tamanrassetensis]
MKRPALWLVAVAVAVAVVTVLLLATSPGAEPVRLDRSGVAVQLDKAGTGSVNAQVEVPAQTVSLYATMPRMGHLTPEIAATQEKPGLFRATGELFSMAGLWELAVRADGRVVTFEITVK